jgi:hypothetical protein
MIAMSHYSPAAKCFAAGKGFGNALTKALPLVAMFGAMTFNAPAWSQEDAKPRPPRGIKILPRCHMGEEACPEVLRMRPGSDVVEATGSVSGEHPNYYFKFDARAGQQATIRIVGGGIKTGPGIPITFPNGDGDAVDEGKPFTLPATGTYVILLHANTMSNGPFGRFQMTLRIN